MKKTQFKNLFRDIKKTWVSFVSITMFIALGIAVFTGMGWSGDALEKRMDGYYNKYKMCDISIYFPLGFTDEDIQEIKAYDGVDVVDVSHTMYEAVVKNGESTYVKICTPTKNLNQLIDIDGKMPETSTEIAVGRSWAKANKVKIGDTIEFASDKDNNLKMLGELNNFDEENRDVVELGQEVQQIDASDCVFLNSKKFTVTALVDTPEYLESSAVGIDFGYLTKTMVDTVMYVSEDAINTKYDMGCNTIYICSNSLKGLSCYDDEYKVKVDALKNTISDKIKPIVDRRNAEILAKGNRALDKADTEIAGWNNKVNEYNKQLEKAQKEIDKVQMIQKRMSTLLADVKALKNDIRADENPNADAYSDRILAIENEDVLPLIQQLNSLTDSEKALIANELELNEIGASELGINDVGLNDISSIPNEMILAKNEGNLDNYIDQKIQYLENVMRNLKNKLEKMMKQILQYKAQLEDAKIQLQDASQKVSDTREAVAKYQNIPSVVLDRNNNVTNIKIDAIVDIFAKMRLSMAVLFIVVGLLVCYSAISRLVNEQMVLIGVKKAIGLRRREITLSVMMYSVLALIVGCILGLLIGVFLVEYVLGYGLESLITIQEITLSFSAVEFFAICAFEGVFILLVTYLACRFILKQKAVELLAGQKQSNNKHRFYEKLGIWKKMSLFARTIVNNFFEDKKRVVATLVGVTGCTALIVTAITLNDNVLSSFSRQYGQEFTFDKTIMFDNTIDNANENVKAVLDSKNITSTPIFETTGYVRNGEDTAIVTVYVVEDVESAKKLFNIRKVLGKSDDTTKGFWINYSVAKNGALDENSLVELKLIDGSSMKVAPDGYYSNYLTDVTAFITLDKYQEMFGISPAANAYLINSGDFSREELKESLKSVEGFYKIENVKDSNKNSFDMFKKISVLMVAVYIGLALIMAALVLVNLFVMFVQEKKRELIILLINGYGLKDAYRYIYLDTIILTFVGIIFGLILGSFVGNLSVSAFDGIRIYFRHGVDWIACLVGVGVTAVFSFGACLIALRQIKNFNLTDINKI